ncbi:ribokinase [Rhodohalobacter sulfatireducens]|uniref:Ribokinase n=1 Tax=Rhodohalobacter sulfatireducens TaxID=2911366 RepID=A0ABS9KEY6_9BACT|nr:ribokinase [Rhodohalobacter sulfatireducens]MCG2589401.1 ribokinase [Rhodohalobacter sulfatireducens]
MSEIIVLGSSNTDMIVKVPRIPAPGETILGGEFVKAAGGKGANQAVAAARSGGDVTFIANTGDDNLGKEAIEGFKKEGINTNHIFVDADAPSGVALIFVGEDGENSIAVASGANGKLTPSQIDEIEYVISGGSILLTQLETPLETVERAIKIANKNGVKVILNPAPAQSLSDDLLKQIDILTPNQSEAELLTGIKVDNKQSAQKAAANLISKGVKTVILTLGPDGAFLMSEDFQKMIPGFKVEAEDTTAAGDTFNGALAVGLAAGKTMEDAITWAHAAAGLSVMKMGAQPSIPQHDEINNFLTNATN